MCIQFSKKLCVWGTKYKNVWVPLGSRKGSRNHLGTTYHRSVHVRAVANSNKVEMNVYGRHQGHATALVHLPDHLSVLSLSIMDHRIYSFSAHPSVCRPLIHPCISQWFVVLSVCLSPDHPYINPPAIRLCIPRSSVRIPLTPEIRLFIYPTTVKTIVFVCNFAPSFAPKNICKQVFLETTTPRDILWKEKNYAKIPNYYMLLYKTILLTIDSLFKDGGILVDVLFGFF